MFFSFKPTIISLLIFTVIVNADLDNDPEIYSNVCIEKVDIGVDYTPLNKTNCDDNLKPIVCMKSSKTQEVMCGGTCFSVQEPHGNIPYVDCFSSETPNNCTQHCSLSPEDCAGDDSYCDYFGKKSCTNANWKKNGIKKADVRCQCTIQYLESKKYCEFNTGRALAEEISIETSRRIDVEPEQELPRKPFRETVKDFESRKYNFTKSKRMGSLTQISFDQPHIVVTTPQPNETTIWTSKDGSNNIIPCTTQRCTVTLPDDYFYSSGKLRVKVYIGDLLDNDKEFDVSAYIKCNVPREIFSYEMYDDFSCFPWQFQMFMVSSLLSVLAVAGLLCYIGVTKFQTTCNALKQSTNVAVNFVGGDGAITQELKPMRRRRGSNRRYIVESSSSSMSMVVICLLLVAQTYACDSGITVEGSITNCFINGSEETCTLSVDTLVSIPFVGGSACIIFTSDSGDIVGNFTIKYDQAIERVDMSYLYTTDRWVPNTQANKQCYLEEGCTANLECDTFDGTSDVSAGGLLTGLGILRPGLTQCDRSCGCAGCGCFSCLQACTYHRYAFFPMAYCVDVLAPSYRVLEPDVSYNAVLGDQYIIEGSLTEMQVVNNIGDFQLRLMGNLQGGTTLFGDLKVVHGQGYSLLVEANPLNSNIASQIGDIQGNNCQLMAAGQFTFPQNVVETSVGSTTVTHTFPSSGMDVFLQRIDDSSLPKSAGGILWSYSDGDKTLRGLNPFPGELLIQLTSLNPVTITRNINVVCPALNSFTVEGCHSCVQGAKLIIIAKSECSPGTVSVTATGNVEVNTPSIYLSTVAEEFIITLHAGERYISGTLTVSSDNYSDSIEFSGQLSDPTNVVDKNQTQSGDTDTGAFTLGAVSDWFNGLDDIAKGLLAGGVPALVIALVIGASIFLCAPNLCKLGYSRV